MHSEQDQEAFFEVDFARTDDPYFYDMADRRGTRATLAEEIVWEEEIETGLTNLSLEAWLQAKREELDVALLPPWEELCFQLGQAPE